MSHAVAPVPAHAGVRQCHAERAHFVNMLDATDPDAIRPEGSETAAVLAAWALANSQVQDTTPFGNADGSHAELFDVVKDPDEKQNLAGMHPDLVERLSKAAIAWDRSIESSVRAAPPTRVNR